jgi:hypothetical protein
VAAQLTGARGVELLLKQVYRQHPAETRNLAQINALVRTLLMRICRPVQLTRIYIGPQDTVAEYSFRNHSCLFYRQHAGSGQYVLLNVVFDLAKTI